jgi:hypothetical protein
MKTAIEINGVSFTGINEANEATVRALAACITGVSSYNGEPTVDVDAAAVIIREIKLASWPARLAQEGAFFDTHTSTCSIKGALKHYGARISFALSEAKTSAAPLSAEAQQARKLLAELPEQKLNKTIAAYVGFSGEFAAHNTIRFFLDEAADGAEVFTEESEVIGVSEAFDTSIMEIVEPIYAQKRGRKLVRILA